MKFRFRFLLCAGIAVALGSMGITHAASLHFGHDLHYGETQSDVSSLQAYLLQEGYFHYSVTGYFGPITFAAVKEWQAADCIPPTGYFGPISRGFVNGGAALCPSPVASTTDPAAVPMPAADPPPAPAIAPSPFRGGVTVTVPPPISVTVSPSATTTMSGATTTFTAALTNASNQTVIWSAMLGLIDASSGIYTAPTVYMVTTDTVTAESQQNGSKTGTATVTIDPLPVTISISPSSTTVFSGATTTFAATVGNASTSQVIWSAVHGTVNASGTYTAPTLSSSTVEATDTVTVTSVADNTKIATASVTVTNGIVDEWKLDEGTGTIAIDSVNSAHDGTWYGTPSGASGYYDPARPSSTLAYSGYFNDLDDYIDPNLTINYTATSSFTWSVWVDLSAGVNDTDVILGSRLGPNWVKLTPTAFEYYTGGLLSNTIPTNQWEYVAVVKSGTSFYYYQNGTLEDSASSTDVPGDLNFYIGTDPNDNQDGYTFGSLSDIRIYGTALTQSQVQAIYNGN